MSAGVQLLPLRFARSVGARLRSGESNGRLARLTVKGGTAILDQALFAGSNFLVSVLLARWLPVEQYGAFAVAYTSLQLLFALHASCTSEPLMVYGPGRFAAQQSHYLSVSTKLALWLGGGFCASLLIVALVLGVSGSDLVAVGFFGMAIAGPAILMQRFFRSAFYMRLEPRGAVAGGVLYLLITVGLLWMAASAGLLNLFTGALVMGVSSVVSAVYFQRRLRARRDSSGLSLREVASVNWHYSRWALPAAALTFVPGNLCYLLLPLWSGLEGTARLQAAMNLVLPVLHANGAIAMLLVPAFVTVRRRGGDVAMRRAGWHAFLLLASTSVVYFVFLVVLGPTVADWLYKGQYADLDTLIALAGLLPLAGATVTILAGLTRAMERPRDVFWGYGAAFAFSITGGVALLWRFGVIGAIVGLILSSLLTAGSLAFSLSRRARERSPGTLT